MLHQRLFSFVILFAIVLTACQEPAETAVPTGTPPPTLLVVEAAAVPPTAVPSTTVPIDPPPTVTPLPAPATLTPRPTVTSSPTPSVTNTPVATDTPVPSATPVATLTSPPPTIVIPTPTDTAVPPTPVPVPHNLSATFLIEGGTSFAINQDIWFAFDVKNPEQVEVEYGALGLLPRKNGVDRFDLFQRSWTNATLFPNGLVWRDHINIGEPGDYSMRIVICLQTPVEACSTSTSHWYTLSPYELAITVR